MNVVVRNIPNTITCLNLVAGCVAIVFASKGETPCGGLTSMQWAYICIAVAAAADFCDGLMARLLHAYSNLGKELDSLCDLVSFGVAPAMMLYRCLMSSEVTAAIAPAAILIPVCGALRLAKFNIDDRQSTTFIGLPIPANAIFWIGFTAIFSADAGMIGSCPVLVIIAAESYSMVCGLKMFSFKFKNLGWRDNSVRWIMLAVSVVLVSAMGVGGLMWMIVAYVLLSRLPGACK